MSETSTSDALQASVRLTQSLDTVYYPVTGTTTRDIFDSVNANGPDLGTELPGHFTSGLTKSSASYRSEFIDYGGSCELEAVEIELGFVVTLPGHSDPSRLSTLQLGRWQEFDEAVRVHEQTHVDIYIEGAVAFEKRVKGLRQEFSDCDALGSALASAWEAEKALTDRKQEVFHQSEKQISLELRGPVQQNIDANKLALADLKEDITSDSSEIQRLNVLIDDLDAAMKPYDDQMAAIRVEYPRLVLPAETFDEYERLLTGWDRLNDQRSEVIAELNALADSHNRAVKEFNRLTEETNKLIDEMAWLP